MRRAVSGQGEGNDAESRAMAIVEPSNPEPQRSCVITGAAGAIGAATTRHLVLDGWHVVAVDIDAPRLDRLTSSLCAPDAVSVLAGDVNDDGVLERAAACANAAGRLKGWVNNAATFGKGNLHDTPFELLRTVLRANIEPALIGSAIAVRSFLETGTPGSIVNISSIQGRRAVPDHVSYSSAKAAMEAIVRNIAVDFGPSGIRANAVAPGTIHRPDQSTKGPVPHDRLRADVNASNHPLGRIGAAEEVASLVAFLLGDHASFITGTVIPVDGGWMASAQSAAT